MFTSASLIGPQAYPLANCAHSATGLPLPSTCCGSDSDGDSADDMTLSPVDAVSTRTWSITWQAVLLPGAQMVMVVKARLTPPAGPDSTEIGSTFRAGAAMTLALGGATASEGLNTEVPAPAPPLPPPPPPPHPD